MSEEVGELLSLQQSLQQANTRNEGLSEELEKCRQDKDFVWNLWKELQSENPDVTKLIKKQFSLD